MPGGIGRGGQRRLFGAESLKEWRWENLEAKFSRFREQEAQSQEQSWQVQRTGESQVWLEQGGPGAEWQEIRPRVGPALGGPARRRYCSDCHGIASLGGFRVCV